MILGDDVMHELAFSENTIKKHSVAVAVESKRRRDEEREKKPSDCNCEIVGIWREEWIVILGFKLHMQQ